MMADKGTIVYVGGLVGDVKKEDLESEFEKFGKLNRVWVAFNPPGFAFVEFSKKDDAEAAVSTLHDTVVFGSKLRVEISRGRGRGGRGGMSGRGGDRGGRGSFRGSRGDFRGGRGDFGRGMGRGGRGDFPRGRGFARGRGGFGGGHPFDREEEFEPFRGGRFNDFEDRRRLDFPERDFGGPREFGARGGPNRDYGEFDDPRGFGAGRDVGRDFGPRGVAGGRDFLPRDMGDREFLNGRADREFGSRDYGVEREMNGVRPYGTSRDVPPVERPYGGPRDLGGARDFGVSQATLGGREYGGVRDIPPGREIGGPRDFAPGRDYDVGMKREPVVRDFNAPREFGVRPSRVDYAEDRYGAGGRGGDMRRAGGFDGGRYAGGDIGGSADYGGYGARDRFRSRSPIGRVSRPMY